MENWKNNIENVSIHVKVDKNILTIQASMLKIWWTMSTSRWAAQASGLLFKHGGSKISLDGRVRQPCCLPFDCFSPSSFSVSYKIVHGEVCDAQKMMGGLWVGVFWQTRKAAHLTTPLKQSGFHCKNWALPHNPQVVSSLRFGCLITSDLHRQLQDGQCKQADSFSSMGVARSHFPLFNISLAPHPKFPELFEVAPSFCRDITLINKQMMILLPWTWRSITYVRFCKYTSIPCSQATLGFEFKLITHEAFPNVAIGTGPCQRESCTIVVTKVDKEMFSLPVTARAK